MLDSADGDADPYPNQNNKMKRSILKYVESITAVWRDKQVQLCFFCVEREELFFLWEVTHCFFIIIAICLIMSAYFSATETAFLSLNRIRMKNMADKGNKRAALVLELEEKYDNLLSTILIGNNIVNILSSSLQRSCL